MYHAATKHIGFRARALGVSNIRSALSTSVTRLRVKDGLPNSPTLHVRHNSHAAAHNVYQENEQDALQETFNKLLKSAGPTTKSRSPPKFGSFAQKKTQSASRKGWVGTFDHLDTPRSIFSSKDEGKSSISRLITSKPLNVQRAYENDEHQDSSGAIIRGRQELNEEVKKRLDSMTPSAIYQELRVTALRDGCDPRTVQAWCQYMVQERAQLPNLEMFSALILVNVNPARGSARHLKRTLKEMETHKVALDARTCHDILKVLSIHPDFLLVSDLLEYMRSRWFTLTDEGHRDLLLIYLRSDQTELALEKLDTMLEEGTTIQPWLFDIVIYHLCYLEEYDEILRLLQIRLHDGKNENNISLTMWGIVLDLAAKGSQSELMMYIWDQRVKPGYLYPPSGVCMNVMLSAVREGNTDLATEVFGLLGDRGITFDHSHYELLLEAYVEAEDLHGALDLLCVMQESRIEPDRSSIASLLRYLMRDPTVCTQAFTYLQQLKTEDDRTVPLAAVNALIEVLATKTNGQRLSEAVEIYKALKTVVPAGPNLETMNFLLEGCRDALNPSLALSLASEMPILGLKPDARTYNALIRSVLRYRKAFKTEGSSGAPASGTEGSRADPITALAYYDEAQAQGLQLDFVMLYNFVNLLSLMGHSRAMDVFSDMEMRFPRSGKKLEELRERMQEHTLQRLERERAKETPEESRAELTRRKASFASREDPFSWN